MKKSSRISLAVLLSVLVFIAGCVPAKSKPDNVSGNDADGGPVTVNIFTPKFPNDGEYSENEFTKLVEKNSI
ncbi:hypothetical protein [Paenibacillus pinihumi]|uniref:hypothetical protein n=1 Tax=Paenibacillus pinihumi TaxID=669462 RepID=UPI000429BB29|nr:hypothetical protein [Paenibacillus pinihumi]